MESDRRRCCAVPSHDPPRRRRTDPAAWWRRSRRTAPGGGRCAVAPDRFPPRSGVVAGIAAHARRCRRADALNVSAGGEKMGQLLPAATAAAWEAPLEIVAAPARISRKDGGDRTLANPLGRERTSGVGWPAAVWQPRHEALLVASDTYDGKRLAGTASRMTSDALPSACCLANSEINTGYRFAHRAAAGVLVEAVRAGRTPA